MSRVFVFSDPHFEHENMAIKRGFKNAEEQDKLIIDNWNKVVNKKDTVWILGDITMEKVSGYEKLKELKGIINVVLGNHDKPQHSKVLAQYVNKICSCVKLNDCLLTHIPIHESEINRFKYNIHGHVHDKSLPDERYINVCAENINFTPILLNDLVK